jgi:NAD(P) transhydrogenase subunit alpha
MKAGVPKEVIPGEFRVAAIPETVKRLVDKGMAVTVETGAGLNAGFSDADYKAAGASIATDHGAVFKDADLVLKVQRPGTGQDGLPDEVALLKSGAVLVAFLQPFAQKELLKKLAARRISALAMELVPRTTRAQRMDALSTMSTAAGYKAVLVAAAASSRFFPMLTTAVGTVQPAKVIVIGAGVAGLQAIATAKRLGGVVTAFDTRPVVAEQVKSVGGRFVSLEVAHDQAQDAGGYAKELSAEFYKQEQDLIRRHSKDADVFITTALIPGRRAPLLITEEMVRELKPGSVIVDLAAEQGGNCALTEAGKDVVKHGVRIIGHINLPATLPVHTSFLYARNVAALVDLMLPAAGQAALDLGDEIIRNTLATHGGEVVHPALKS